MQDVGNAVNLFFEDADCARIGEHHAGDAIIDDRRQQAGIDHAFSVRLQIDDFVAADRRRRGVSAVRRIGNDELLARISSRLVICAHEQDAGEFAVSSRRRLKRDRVHSGDFAQTVL